MSEKSREHTMRYTALDSGMVMPRAQGMNHPASSTQYASERVAEIKSLAEQTTARAKEALDRSVYEPHLAGSSNITIRLLRFAQSRMRSYGTKMMTGEAVYPTGNASWTVR